MLSSQRPLVKAFAISVSMTATLPLSHLILISRIDTDNVKCDSHRELGVKEPKPADREVHCRDQHHS
ncbi:hypothetical protein KC325_g284 [Hortaea werneckii]|nr:hypothetical protein KC325_g284 [Hortaea werneckii]